MANKPLRKKYPADTSDSRNTSRGRDELLTGTPKKRVDITYNTIKDEEGLPIGFSNKTKTVTKFKRGATGLESEVVKSKTRRVADSKSYSQDAYAPQVQKKGGAIKKYQTEGEVSKSRTVTKGPLGLTKTIVKTKSSPGKAPVTTTKTRNTVKGALNKVAAKFRRPIPGGGAVPFTPSDSKINYIPTPTKKKGGAIKKKK